MQITSEEKRAFASRLKAALKRAERTVRGPTDLAREFTLRHPKEPISPQAAQRWLSGNGLPTPDKVETLAKWLGVSAHWLRFGTPGSAQIVEERTPEIRRGKPPRYTVTYELKDEERHLLRGFRQLSPEQRKLIVDLIAQLGMPRDEP
jgi:transcriptional regulator with XRE-family HTH domain